jgi:hypothetical protein
MLAKNFFSSFLSHVIAEDHIRQAVLPSHSVKMCHPGIVLIRVIGGFQKMYHVQNWIF